MVAVEGIYYQHPDTGEAGLWVQVNRNRIVGRSDAEMSAWLAAQGITTVEAAQPFVAEVEAFVNDGLADKVNANQFFGPDWTKAEKDAWMANPPEFYSVVGNTIIIQRTVFSLVVLSVLPLRYQPTVSNGASGTVIVPG